jgi:hypothetical protein
MIVGVIEPQDHSEIRESSCVNCVRILSLVVGFGAVEYQVRKQSHEDP